MMICNLNEVERGGVKIGFSVQKSSNLSHCTKHHMVLRQD